MLGYASRPLRGDPRRLATILAEQATSPLAGYGTALACVLLAVGLRLGLERLVPGVVPFATLFPAVLVAGLVGGGGPGLLALLLGGGLVYASLPPLSLAAVRLPTADAVSLVLYILSAGIVLAVALALRQSRAQLRRLLDTTPMAILESNAEGVFTYANPSAERLLGLSRAELRTGPTTRPPGGSPPRTGSRSRGTCCREPARSRARPSSTTSTRSSTSAPAAGSSSRSTSRPSAPATGGWPAPSSASST
jgi:PAS domain-containing protein